MNTVALEVVGLQRLSIFGHHVVVVGKLVVVHRGAVHLAHELGQMVRVFGLG